ncbi:MAG: PGF-pre-PGF domain-containing protein [Methanoregula sp.]
MVFLRYGLVLAGFMVVALVLAVPVSAGSVAPGSVALSILNLTDSAGVIPDASVREMFDSAAAGDLIAPGPVSAESVSIGPTDSLQTAINNAADGDTIYLAPGIYREHDLVIMNKNLTIAANESLGGNRDNTIIDAEGNGRIFALTGGPGSRFYLFHLTLRNGRISGDGGAISSDGMNVLITYSTLTNCSASGSGGAIQSEVETLVAFSTISGCSAGGNGGAVYSENLVYLMYTTVSDCTAGGSGGAVYADDVIMIFYSTISDCTAPGGSGGAAYSGYGVGIMYSAITGCSAGVNGGAAYADSVGVEIATSTITDCSAGGDGGAVYSADQIFSLQDSMISDCTAGGNGGAVYSTVSTPLIFLGSVFGFLIDDATITGCTAGGSGGAVYSDSVADTFIISSQFSGCSASANGGAIWSYGGLNTSMNFSRIYGNTPTAVYSPTSPFNARNNWWGSNNGPAAGSVTGNVDYSPWLVLGISSSSGSVMSGTGAAIRTNLTGNSGGEDTYAGGLFVPDGIINRFTVRGSGSVLPVTAGTVDGCAGTTFTAGSPGTSQICGTVDGQTVCVSEKINYPPATMGPFNDDDSLPGITPVPTADPSTVLPMTVTVNIGGNSAAGKTTVTGTKLSGLVVTGTVQPGPGSNQTAPPGIVYQYISLVPAGYTTISSTVINFTVPQSWLEENGIAPAGVVLYHQTADGWEALPTSVLYTKDGMAYFSAQSPGFSLFAIAGTPAAALPVTTVVTPVDVSTPAREPGPVRTTVTQAPVVTETTEAPPAAEAPAGSSGFPVVPALIGICCVGLIGGGYFARRWWIRRQNPALFAEYD